MVRSLVVEGASRDSQCSNNLLENSRVDEAPETSEILSCPEVETGGDFECLENQLTDLESSEFDSDNDFPQLLSDSDEQIIEQSEDNLSLDDELELADDELELAEDEVETLNDDFDLNKELFEPIYENAGITLCGAYCAIMEFKRMCKLPFSSLAMLLQLLQLLCPPGNNLPHTVYAFKKVFGKASSCKEILSFCADCNVQFCKGQNCCRSISCRKTEPSKLMNLDVIEPMKGILSSK